MRYKLTKSIFINDFWKYQSDSSFHIFAINDQLIIFLPSNAWSLMDLNRSCQFDNSSLRQKTKPAVLEIICFRVDIVVNLSITVKQWWRKQTRKQHLHRAQKRRKLLYKLLIRTLFLICNYKKVYFTTVI